MLVYFYRSRRKKRDRHGSSRRRSSRRSRHDDAGYGSQMMPGVNPSGPPSHPGLQQGQGQPGSQLNPFAPFPGFANWVTVFVSINYIHNYKYKYIITYS